MFLAWWCRSVWGNMALLTLITAKTVGSSILQWVLAYGYSKNILTKVIVHRFDHKVSLIRLEEDFQCKLMHKKRFIVRLRSKISTSIAKMCIQVRWGCPFSTHTVFDPLTFLNPSPCTQNYVIVTKYGYLICTNLKTPPSPLRECGTADSIDDPLCECSCYFVS